jgi:branched-chain amino acid transport system permease protein
VVGGMCSLKGAFFASLLIGMLQTLAVGIDVPLLGWAMAPGTWGYALWKIKVSQIAPLLPYLLLVLVLLMRPHGIWGRRAD